jgi:diguanylate cyclase (GGDEF)-like protein
MAATAAALLAGPISDLGAPATSVRLPWPALAALFAAAAVLRVHIQFRREVHSVNLVELPLVLGLHLASSLGLAAARLIGSLAALVLGSRQTGLKLAFNLALSLLEACLAIVVFAAVLGDHPLHGTTDLAATFTAVLATDLVSAALVLAAIRLNDGRVAGRDVVQALVTGAVAAITTGSLAMVAVVVLRHDRQVAWLLLVVAGTLYLAYRAYASLREQHSRLHRLQRFVRVVGRSERSGTVTATVLAQARDLLRAERAEITLFTAGRPRVRTTLGPGDHTETAPVADPVAATRLLELAQAEDGPRLEDAIVAPLRDAGGAFGTLLVVDRQGDVGAFDDRDVTLLQTLAGHASIALERSRLIDDLRREVAEREHQALHDGLTGLANRALFLERVRQAIAGLGPNASLAVLLVDLDRFKEVNDTLGHSTGDLVLREVGARLERTLPESHTIARLGGDEFAVLVPAIPDREAALGVARTVRAQLERPLTTDELELQVAGSVGLALCPEHGADPGLLLQRADVAMYAAKAAHSGIEVYAADRDQYSPRRLALVGALRSAIEDGRLTVVYQPKAELPDGRVIGMEALVRWLDPAQGAIAPDEFIPIAESTGLIAPLCRFVLEVAVGQATEWRRQGLAVGMAVNLSVRNLLEPGLADRVRGLLAASGLPAGLLTLEITEGAVMTDPAAAIAVLHQLAGAGVRLSIDDFGTGYSSLAYLKRLPVDEVKLDKSFVLGMTTDPDDAAIVRSTVELTRNLGLRMVAEGVEDQATWDALAAMGCELAQGYHLARPMPPEEASDWLALHGAGRSTMPAAERR